MLQNGDIELVRITWVLGCQEPQKANVIFENSTFEIAYRENFVKIKKLIRFGQKCSNLGIWAQKFQKQMSGLKSGPLK